MSGMAPFLSVAAARAVRSLPDLRGKSNVGWKLMRHSSLEGSWAVGLRDGTRMNMPRTSEMAWLTAFRGSYDPALQRLLSSYIAPDSIVLDIGAALGLWTVPLARAAAACGSELWAFEPFPGNHGWLESNIAANSLNNVTVQRFALGQQAGTAFMTVEDGGSGNAAIRKAEDGDSEVPVRALDSFAFPAPVSAVKIDVEGYELQVLRGASALLERHRPVILGEFNASWLEKRGEAFGDLMQRMQDLDYVVYGVGLSRARPWMAPRRVELHELRWRASPEELLLVPRERAS
jgi:FkbM family methyltransferase